MQTIGFRGSAGRTVRCVAAAGVLAVTIVGTAPGADVAGLRARLGAVFEHPDFRNAAWGCVVAGAADGAVLFAHNPRHRLIPASNQKLYVAGACLAELGGAYRSKTEFLAAGEVRNGTLHGDLVVRGYGAFDLTARFPRDVPVARKAGRLNAALERLAERLRERGVSRITGRVTGDASAWTDMVRNTHYPSAAALLFHDNTLEIGVTGGRVATCPPERYMFKLLATRAGPAQERASGADTIRVNVRQDSTDYWRLRHGDAVAYAAGQIRRGLVAAGLPVDGAYAARAPSRDATPLLVRRGAPLRDVLKGVLTWSDNLRAEVLFLSLGYEVEGRADYARASRACSSALLRAGLRLPDYVAADGSGLSRDNRVSAIDTVDLLRWLRREHYPVMRSALAVSGRTGTLRKRLAGARVRGRVLAKTGSLRGVRALSGYITTQAGTPLCFAFICNDAPSDARAWAAIESACEAICGAEGKRVCRPRH